MYKGRSLSASGRISCPDDDTVAQNLRYECRMLMQRFVTCSLTCESGVEGISLAAAQVHIKIRIMNYVLYSEITEERRYHSHCIGCWVRKLIIINWVNAHHKGSKIYRARAEIQHRIRYLASENMQIEYPSRLSGTNYLAYLYMVERE